MTNAEKIASFLRGRKPYIRARSWGVALAHGLPAQPPDEQSDRDE